MTANHPQPTKPATTSQNRQNGARGWKVKYTLISRLFRLSSFLMCLPEWNMICPLLNVWRFCFNYSIAALTSYKIIQWSLSHFLIPTGAQERCWSLHSFVRLVQTRSELLIGSISSCNLYVIFSNLMQSLSVISQKSYCRSTKYFVLF